MAGLLPTLGFVPFRHQGISTVADRYAYLAMLGPAIAASGEYKVKYKPHASLARTLHQLGEREKAELAYERAIVLAPGWAQLRNDDGVLLAESGRFCEAAHCFREARRLGLDTPEVRQNPVAAETRCGEQSTEK